MTFKKVVLQLCSGQATQGDSQAERRRSQQP